MVKVGDTIPEATLMVSGNPEDDANICANPKPVKTSEFFKGKKTVIFAVPGAFTPLCHIQHVPSFLKNAAKIKAKGIDQIACLSVNDVFVMDAWGKAERVGKNIVMLADGNGDFVKKLGLSMDGSKMQFGAVRSQRWAMIVNDGKIEYLGVDSKGLEKSGGDAVLAKL